MRRGYRVDEAQTLNPGLLRHSITWQRKVQATKDESGNPITGLNTFNEPIYDWADLITVRAQVKDMPGAGESGAAGQRWAEAKYEIMQHYIVDLKPSDRGAWRVGSETRYLDIVDINDRAGTRRVLHITCREWVERKSFG